MKLRFPARLITDPTPERKDSHENLLKNVPGLAMTNIMVEVNEKRGLCTIGGWFILPLLKAPLWCFDLPHRAPYSPCGRYLKMEKRCLLIKYALGFTWPIYSCTNIHFPWTNSQVILEGPRVKNRPCCRTGPLKWSTCLLTVLLCSIDLSNSTTTSWFNDAFTIDGKGRGCWK